MSKPESKEEKIVFISAGMTTRKNEYKEYERDQRYLNYGLLGLVTNLSEKGYAVKMFQGDKRAPETVLAEMEEHCIINKSCPVFLSIPSFFHVEWCVKFSALVKAKYEINIVAGGRWVIDKNLEWIKKKLPLVDFFIKGCPDEEMELFLNPKNWKNCKEEFQYEKPFFRFQYTLLHRYQEYQPVIEVSRGCSGGCRFCLESHYKHCAMKSPAQVLKEAEEILQQYGLPKDTPDFYFYLEGAIFVPDKKWALEYVRLYREGGFQFQFRMQSRVDCLKPELVKLLSEGGLKVIDLGLESASEVQLLRMGKTSRPEHYLESAKRLLQAATECGVWTKLNLLLYPGETRETLLETKHFLREMKPYFKGISCNPLMLYLNGEETEEYIKTVEQLSGGRVDRKVLLQKGYVTAPLDGEGSRAKTDAMVNEFYREFMTQEDYLELKDVTYSRRMIR